MNSKASILFEGKCPEAAVLFNYSKGLGNAAAIHTVEQHLLSCPLCNDALEAMTSMPDAGQLTKIGEHNPYVKPNISGGLWSLSIIILITAVFLYKTGKKNDATLIQKNVSTEKDYENKQFSSSSDTMVAEKYKEQKVETKSELVIAQGKSNSKIMELQNSVVSADSVVSSTLIDSVPTGNKGVFSSVPIHFSALPVKYVYDLKVIDYKEVYERTHFAFSSSQNNTPASLENKNLKTSNDLLNDTLTSDEILEMSLSYFKNSQYREAIDNFKLLLTKYPDDLNGLFYSGVAYYHLHLYSDAISNFEKVLSHKNTIFNEEALWYSALSWIDIGKTQKAKNMLNEIVNNNGFYSQKAEAKLQILQ
jgi:tetratricopeptide (TPR) repeat protein